MRELILFMILSGSPAQPLPRSPEQELTAIEHALAASWKKGDCDAWSGHIAEGWSVVHLDGSIISRDQALTMCRGPRSATIESFTVDELSIRLFGDTAVVTGRSVLQLRAEKPMTVRLRFTDVFVRRDGVWKAVASHASSIPP
jgi:ketosteroid isomerase-like protein